MGLKCNCRCNDLRLLGSSRENFQSLIITTAKYKHVGEEIIINCNFVPGIGFDFCKKKLTSNYVPELLYSRSSLELVILFVSYNTRLVMEV